MLRTKKPVEPEFELVGGCFDCQEYGCLNRSYEAKYIEQINTLTWVCADNHVSRIENFE